MILQARIAHAIRSARRTAGFTLIEVLTALVVVTVGLLGLSALYIESLKLNTSAIRRHTAITLAADMAERLRADLLDQTATAAPVDWIPEMVPNMPEGSVLHVRPAAQASADPTHGEALNRYDIEVQWPESGQALASSYSLTLYTLGE
jgi:prepilin-type N-terminal cleavage/methylation domain-containing protein